MKHCPFPQANNLDLIFTIFMEIGPKGLSRYDVVKAHGLTERQGSYYLDALLFVGVVEKYNIKYFLNDVGVDIRLQSKDQMKSKFCDVLLKNEFINSVFEQTKYMKQKEAQKEYIENRIFNEYGLSMVTAHRRASTIYSWLDWIRNYHDKQQ